MHRVIPGINTKSQYVAAADGDDWSCLLPQSSQFCGSTDPDSKYNTMQ